MKVKTFAYFSGISLAIIGLTIVSIFSFQDSEPEPGTDDIIRFRKAKNHVLRSKVGTPFYNDNSFDSLHYFPVNGQEVYHSDLFPIKNGELLDLMPDRPGYPSHKVAGYVVLEKETWRDTLFVLKDLEEQSDTNFFIPFTDLSNGSTTYGGGRYLDVVVKKLKPVRLDFNYAFNPYCSYNSEFICPKIPTMNRLCKAIEAGEKLYKNDATP